MRIGDKSIWKFSRRFFNNTLNHSTIQIRKIYMLYTETVLSVLFCLNILIHTLLHSGYYALAILFIGLWEFSLEAYSNLPL